MNALLRKITNNQRKVVIKRSDNNYFVSVDESLLTFARNKIDQRMEVQEKKPLTISAAKA